MLEIYKNFPTKNDWEKEVRFWHEESLAGNISDEEFIRYIIDEYDDIVS